MEKKDEIVTLIRQRADMYRFLARLYVLEVDAELLSRMKQMVFPTDCTDIDLADGYEQLKQYLDTVADSEPEEGQQSMEDAVIDLEVEYARIFLAAGVASGGAAFPYESVYTSEDHLVNQEAFGDVAILYAAKGLKAREDMYRIPDDHAGLEFEYMARLCDAAVAAAEAEDEAGLDESMQEQRTFYRDHLRWIAMFGEDIRKYASTDFFRAIGRITRGFMTEETALLR
ncbi:MAG: molecular chaperone TorD family protein [Lachnospiraceae bacterium]|nr:molecular chaperone TorD family protein [Lachnospiraceae bacterium]